MSILSTTPEAFFPLFPAPPHTKRGSLCRSVVGTLPRVSLIIRCLTGCGNEKNHTARSPACQSVRTVRWHDLSQRTPFTLSTGNGFACIAINFLISVGTIINPVPCALVWIRFSLVLIIVVGVVVDNLSVFASRLA